MRLGVLLDSGVRGGRVGSFGWPPNLHASQEDYVRKLCFKIEGPVEAEASSRYTNGEAATAGRCVLLVHSVELLSSPQSIKRGNPKFADKDIILAAACTPLPRKRGCMVLIGG
jgi:hypothetical protein